MNGRSVWFRLVGLALTFLIIASVASLAGSRPADAARAAPAHLKLTGPIGAAYNSGRISLDDALLYKLVSVTHPALLPAEFRSETVQMSGTPILEEIAAALEMAHPKVTQYIKFLLASRDGRKKLKLPDLTGAPLSRPELAQQALAETLAADNRPRALYNTPEGHFAIYYYTSGKDASTRKYATEFGQYLEESWSYYHDRGYAAPGNSSGSSRLTVNIKDLGRTIYGSTCARVRLVLCNDNYIDLNYNLDFAYANDDPDGKVAGAMKTTAAHELFHSVQWAITGVGGEGEHWWQESSAMFMQEEVYDQVNIHVNWLPKYATQYATPLDMSDGYEMMLINTLLKERFNRGDPAIIKDVLEGIGLFTSAEESMDEVMSRKGLGDFIYLMQEFSLWSLMTGDRHRSGYFEEGASYPTLSSFSGDYALGRTSVGWAFNTSVREMASQYYRFTPEVGSQAGTLELRIKKSDKYAQSTVVTFRTDGRAEVVRVTPNLKGEATVQVSDFTTRSVSESFVILTNAHMGDSRDFTVSASLARPAALDLILLADATGSMGDDLDNVKSSATAIVDRLAADLTDFRVAVADYRDFSQWPYGEGDDYPYRAVLPFSTDRTAIAGALNSLTASGGADRPESAWTALTRAAYAEGLGSWRPAARKAIILLTDAPPHEPEPVSGYTYASTLAALQPAGAELSMASLAAVPATAASGNGAMLFSVIVGGDTEVTRIFGQMSEATGGQLFSAATASEVSQAILTAIGSAIDEEEDNQPPDLTGARASTPLLWPVTHKLIPISITSVVDPDGDPVTITITGISQDEPVAEGGSGSTAPDGAGVGTETAWVRAERQGDGNGRLYRIAFVAEDGDGGRSAGSVLVCVPHDSAPNTECIDDGQSYDATAP